MADINYPNNPNEGDTFNVAGQTFVWNGDAWVRKAATILDEAPADGLPYNRVKPVGTDPDGDWVLDGGPVDDAPVDGLFYGRQEDPGDDTVNIWTPGVPEAPNDGLNYARAFDSSPVAVEDHQMKWRQVFTGYKNMVINGRLLVNQRGVDIGSAGVNSFGQDRWFNVSGTQMGQRIEKNNILPQTEYTLSWTTADGSPHAGVGEVHGDNALSPVGGNFQSPMTVLIDNLSVTQYVKIIVPLDARNIQFERGPVATSYEMLPLSLIENECQRYYVESADGLTVYSYATQFIAGVATTFRQVYVGFPSLMYRIPDTLVAGQNYTEVNFATGTATLTRSSLRMTGTALDEEKSAGLVNIKLNAEIPA